MSFDLPRRRIVPVSTVDVRIDPGPHPFSLEHADAIEANWQREKAANPALYDGEIVLLSSVAYSAGALVGRCHVVRYAALLHWRRGRPQGAEHAFAHAALVTSDGALLAIRMGRHTANPGRVYFAAGSFEPIDFPGGRVDLHANMARELMEETGLDLGQAEPDPQHHLYSADRTTVIFRRYRLPETADALAERISRFVAAESDPEIEGPVVIRSASDDPEGLVPHMRAIVDWHFSDPAPSLTR
jgi:8-oxo-dGTP pyrophosphatase MutT (NUDIX family)